MLSLWFVIPKFESNSNNFSFLYPFLYDGSFYTYNGHAMALGLSQKSVVSHNKRYIRSLRLVKDAELSIRRIINKIMPFNLQI